MKIWKLIVLLAAALALIPLQVCAADQTDEEDQGYLSKPGTFIKDIPELPLSGMDETLPAPHKWSLDFDVPSEKSDGFRQDGQAVQPDLRITDDGFRIQALFGVERGLALGLSVLVATIRARGLIGGEPANGTSKGLGDTTLLSKKILWQNDQGDRLVASLGVTLPTGKDDETFNENNAVTNAFYQNSPRRMPISWQIGSGSVNGLLGLAYARHRGRQMYSGIIGAKINSRGDEDVKLGDMFALALSGSYGLNRKMVVSVGMTASTQQDDSYPNAPGIGQPALAGITVHGTTVFLEPAIRYRYKEMLTIGVGYTLVVAKPDNGLVPSNQLFLILRPVY